MWGYLGPQKWGEYQRVSHSLEVVLYILLPNCKKPFGIRTYRFIVIRINTITKQTENENLIIYIEDGKWYCI